MQFFYTINGWAGQNAFVDGAMRGFYVAAIPLLATILAALLVFRPGRWGAEDASAARIATATLLGVAACLVGMSLLNAFCAHVLNTPILSSRPFVTHRVNALLVEPNDNSFPSPETALIGVWMVSMWAASPRLAWPSLGFALLFCFARVFCGSNYPVDVLAGLLCGVALNMLSLSLCGVALQRVRRLPWNHHLEPMWRRARGQTAAASALIVASLLVLWFGAPNSAHTAKQLRAAWNLGTLPTAKLNSDVSASLGAMAGDRARPIEYSKAGSASSSEALHEGEGGDNSLSVAPVKTVPRPGVTTLGGNLPVQAKQLLLALHRARLAHSLVGVDVAALRGDEHSDDGKEAHFAAVRFQVRGQGATERRRVAQTAQRIVRIAFAQNPRLQNVDVVGVVLSDPARDGVKYPVFSVGAVPVWTASIERRNIVLANGPAWLNQPNTDAGSWLRARSEIYINPRVLPETALRLAEAPLFQSATNAAAKPSRSSVPPSVNSEIGRNSGVVRPRRAPSSTRSEPRFSRPPVH